NGVPCEVPQNVIDGNTNTIWHTMINPKAPGPHYITIILPTAQDVGGYRYYPRTDGGTAGIAMEYVIYASSDNVTFYRAASGTWAFDSTVKSVYFPKNLNAKAIKLEILSSIGGYGSAGELRLLSTDPTKETMEAKDLAYLPANFYVPSQFGGTITKASNYSNPVGYLFDGVTSTYWHSQIVQNNLPVDLTFSFNYAYHISGIGYLPRQDSSLTGHFQQFNIYMSNDGVNYTLVKSATFDTIDHETKYVVFDNEIATRFIKITVNQGLNNYASCGELTFLQTKEMATADAIASKVEYTLQIGSNNIIRTRGGISQEITADAAPLTQDGYVMIPLGGLLEDMGATVEWVAYNQKIEIYTSDNRHMTFQIEEARVYIDNIRFTVAAPPVINDSKIYIPLKFVSEHLGYNYSWDGATQTITITSK
ncbi:MAG: discoidin domain-containing protein, partial [Bacillota bacterium]|nr:discoidin domain-containing protein [Bacillota bacterium]